MATRIGTRPTITTPSTDTNLGEDVRQQREDQREAGIINDALKDTGTTIDRDTQAITDRSGFAQATLDWRNYMSNYMANNTQRLIDNAVPVFSIKDGKMHISGTRDALNSAIASDAKKALSSSLSGVDLGTEAAQEVVNALNESIKSGVTEYIATQVYGFEDNDDYNNYLLAVQESQKINPTNSTYYFMARDKDGNLVRKTFSEWIDYWRSAYNTDERVDLFLNSANSPYGYDRIPYVLMSGGGLDNRAKYGFDAGEYFSIGAYNTGAQISKLPHGLTQTFQMGLSGVRNASTLLDAIGTSGDTDSTTIILNAPEVNESVFNSILKKLAGEGPQKGGIDSLSDQEKAILSLGVSAAANAQVYKTDTEYSKAQLEELLKTADYDTYKNRSSAAKELREREGKMSGVEGRIAKNMSVYGGGTNYFISNMLGVMARQMIEAYAVKALTGGRISPNEVGEKLGDAIADTFGVNAAGEATILGTAMGKSFARFIGGIPEDMAQDLLDSIITNDPTLGEDVFTWENVGQNLVYRLTFNAIVKGAGNVIKNVRFLKQIEKAAKDAGYDIDADDIKRGVSEAYSAFQNGRAVGVDDQGRVIFEDDEGNLKTLDNVTIWSVQPLKEMDGDDVVSQAVRDKVNDLTNEWKEKQKVSTSDISAIRNYVVNGDYIATTADDFDFEVPKTIKNSISHLATNFGFDVDENFRNIYNRLSDWGLDDRTILSSIDPEKGSMKNGFAMFDDIFGAGTTARLAQAETLDDFLRSLVNVLDRDSQKPLSPEQKTAIVGELRGKLNRLIDQWDNKVASLEPGETPDFHSVMFGLSASKELTPVLNNLSGEESWGLLNRGGTWEGAANMSGYPSMSVRNYIENGISFMLADIAEKYVNAIDKMSFNSTADFLSATVNELTRLASDENTPAAMMIDYKNSLDRAVALMDELEYQKNYNQLYTPLPDYVLGDIHSTNELGVKFNEQKMALMDEAKNTSASDFVFTKLQDETTIVAGYQTKGDFDDLFSRIMNGETPEIPGVEPARIQQFYNDAKDVYERVLNTSEDFLYGAQKDMPVGKALLNDINELNRLEAEFLNDAGLRKNVSKEGFTQNELLEIWTEAQYRNMDSTKMLGYMTSFGIDDGQNAGAGLIKDSEIVQAANRYINEQDRMPARFWYSVTGQYKSPEFDSWLNDLQRNNHPGIYIKEDGSRKVSGRSILETQVLSDPKLWAATLVKLKGDLGSTAMSDASRIANLIQERSGVYDVRWRQAILAAYDQTMPDEVKKMEISKALKSYTPGMETASIPVELGDLLDTYFSETGASKNIDNMFTGEFVRWVTEKYAMGETLYYFRENIAVKNMTMGEFLNTPISLGRVERVWGPNRLVYVNGNLVAPTMDLSYETSLSFSWSDAGADTGVFPSDPGHVLIKARPIDIIGGVESMYEGEHEVLVRKGLVYPAGNKMFSIFMDGKNTTVARGILGDKNARMFQVDDSLVVNNHDYRALSHVLTDLAEAKHNGWVDVNTGKVVWSSDKKAKNTLIKNFLAEPLADHSASKVGKTLSGTIYGEQIANILENGSPLARTALNNLIDKYYNQFSLSISPKPETAKDISVLFGRPFIIGAGGDVFYTNGIVPALDTEIRTNGGTHLNDPQAKRTADVQQVLEDWKTQANKVDPSEQMKFFDDNAGIMVDGQVVSFASLVDDATASAKLKTARDSAKNASDNITMKNRLEGTPSDSPDPSKYGEQKTYSFNSYADALANRPSYKNSQDVDAWLPAAIDAGMKEFSDWKTNVFDQNHPGMDTAQLVETWDFINFLVHEQEDINNPDMSKILGKTFIDSTSTEVTVTQEALDMYGEFDAFIRQQGARIAALQARGFEQDYNQLGYLPHTDYNPMNQSAEEMIQGALWRKNELKNSTTEDGTFTTEKLDNSWENRYRVWISNMSYDSLGDVAIFSEKMKELIADGVVTINQKGTGFVDGEGHPVKPQETVAKAISGDKNLEAQMSKAKSAKSFMDAHTKMDGKTDFKALDEQIRSDAEKMGYSEALHKNYGDMYGNGRAAVTKQSNVVISKITGLYDFMRNTATTDGNLLNHGGEMLINPNGLAKYIIRQYRDTGDLKAAVVDLLIEKSGRTRKGAEYVYSKWLPDIQKKISAKGTINSTELSAVLTKKIRSEAWTSIKKWLARADYESFNVATKQRLDNLLYRHSMIAQVSNNPSVMKTLNKAMNTIIAARHRALFYLNPKNALLQLSECIRLFSEFALGDATKTLKRLSTDSDFRNTVAEWKEIVFPDREPLQNVEPMADAWGRTAGSVKLSPDGTLDIKNTVKGGIQEADAVMMAPINAAEDMKNTVLIAGIVQEMETKKANGTLKEPEYDYVMRRFQRIGLANDEFGRLGYSDNPFARTLLYLQNFSIRELKMFGDNVVDSWGSGGLGKATAYVMKVFGWRMGLFLIMAKLGYSAGQVLGYDPFDLISDDYTGLDEEDETELDRQIKSGWVSPLFAGGITSLIQQYYFAARQAYERSNEVTPADEASALANDQDTWGLQMPEFNPSDVFYQWAPGGGATRRILQMAELMDKGEAISQSGTRMYEAPDNLGDVMAGYLFGRSNTSNARAYYQTPDPLQGLVDNGLPGFAQQMGRAFSNDFRQFDPIDTQNYDDWFDGSAADEQQWQSGYYYFRNRAKEIYDIYNNQANTYNSTTDTAELKSSYVEEMDKLGEQLNRFSQAYIRKHGSLGGVKMQQLLNILNDAQTNLLMDDAEMQKASLEGLNRAQERYTQAGLPAETRMTGPSTYSPGTRLQTRFSPQYYSAVQGVYGGSAEAAKILDNLYQTKWKDLRKQYSNKAFADGVSYADRKKIQNEYINIVRQDLDGIVATYGTGILNTDAVDDVLTDVFAGMVPYEEYNVNKYGRYVSLPSNTEVDVSDWLLQKYANANSAPRTQYNAGTRATLEQIRALQNAGKTSQAKATARLLLQRVQDNRASLTRDELEWLQGVLND